MQAALGAVAFQASWGTSPAENLCPARPGAKGDSRDISGITENDLVWVTLLPGDLMWGRTWLSHLEETLAGPDSARRNLLPLLYDGKVAASTYQDPHRVTAKKADSTFKLPCYGEYPLATWDLRF